MANKPAALNKQGQLGPKAKQGTGDFGPPGESAKSVAREKDLLLLHDEHVEGPSRRCRCP
jgi:hypothetical protein